MKQKFSTYVMLSVLVILVALFWHRHVQHSAGLELATPTGLRNTIPPVSPPIGSVPVRGNTNALPTAPQINATPSVANNVKLQQVVQQFVENKNVPVEFCGLVIDQDSNVLAGVDVKIAVQQLTVPDPATAEPGTTVVRLEQITGTDGRFEFSGLNGDGFDLESMRKEGYEAEPTRRGFSSSSGSFSQPVIFKMWSTNIHEQLIGGKKAFHIIPDGRPYFINLTDGTIAESGEGDLKVWVQYTSDVVRGQLYAWSAGIDVQNGGLLEEPLGAPMYEAPPDGYIPQFHLEQQIKGGQRGQTGEHQFYLHLNNGQEFGQMTIDLYAPFNDQTPGLVRLSYVINPSGSRILR